MSIKQFGDGHRHWAWHASGHLMLEAIITIGISAILIHMQWPIMRQVLGQMGHILGQQKTRVERLDMHQLLSKDLMLTSMSHVGDCCFRNQSILICYDINADQFRRRKKRHQSTRFYSHFIGNHIQHKALTCNVQDGVVHMSFKVSDNHGWEWAFHL